MAMRVKNVEAGKRVMIGGKLRFIPFRKFPPSSDHAGEYTDDYDPTKLRNKRSAEYRTAMGLPLLGRGKRKKAAPAKRKHKPATRKRTKNPAPVGLGARTRSAKAAWRVAKMIGGSSAQATKAAVKQFLRTKNPIPTKWVAANVKRVGNDIQVMLFPKGKVAKRRAAKRKVTRRAAPRRRTARRR